MINAGIFRGGDDTSDVPNVNKPETLEQKVPRVKTKALGDVLNTLHSRPITFVNPNKNPATRITNKSSVYSKLVSHENVFSTKNSALRKSSNVIPVNSVSTFITDTPDNDEVCEIHNHILCEEDQQAYVNDYFKEYKLSEEQINTLVRSIKTFATPVSVEVFEPCEDIEIPVEKKFEEKSFSLSDIFSDVVLPQIPPPLKVL